jgi:glutathione S-transferase
MYHLYYSPGACSLAPHIVLEEIGAPYELALVTARDSKMTGTAEWRAVNPKGRVPALRSVPGRIGGAPDLLTEAHAILFYLARMHPAAALLPREPAGEARAIEWMNWLASNVHAMSYGLIWRPRRFSADPAHDAALKEQGDANLREQCAYIEQLLGDGRDWAVPGGYSVVDPYLLVFYHWGQRVGLAMRETCPAWARLTRKTIARPAVARVLAQEEIEIPA